MSLRVSISSILNWTGTGGDVACKDGTELMLLSSWEPNDEAEEEDIAL